MFLKKFILFISLFGFMYLFSISASAAPTEEESEIEEDTFFDVFEVDVEAVVTNVEAGEFGLYTNDEKEGNIQIDEESLELTSINDFGDFDLTKGFSRASIATFSKSKILTGKGELDTVVGYCVFSISEDHEMVVEDQGYNKIGITGIFNKLLSFGLGENYVIIAVKNEDQFIYRLYKVSVMEEVTKGLLENIEINFIPNIPTIIPGFTPPTLGIK